MSEFFSKKLTRVSFILSICIIFYHSSNLKEYPIAVNNPLYIFQTFLNAIIDIAVPTFFIMSGYLYYYNCDSVNTGFKKAKKRIFSLLIPYLFFSTLYTVYFMVLSNVPFFKGKINYANAAKLNVGNVFSGVFLAKYAGILYYVRNLICLTIIFPIIYYSLKIKPIAYLVLVGLFFVYFFDLNVPSKISLVIKIDVWFWYYLGVVVSVSVKDFKKLKTRDSLIFLSVGLLIVLLLCIYRLNLNIKFSSIVTRIIDKTSSIILVICFWFAFDLVVTEKTIKLENISFFVYCIHSLILESFQKIIFLFGDKNMLFASIRYFIPPCLTYFIIIAIALFMDRFMPKTFKVISGGRTLTKRTTNGKLSGESNAVADATDGLSKE